MASDRDDPTELKMNVKLSKGRLKALTFCSRNFQRRLLANSLLRAPKATPNSPHPLRSKPKTSGSARAVDEQ